MLSARFVAIIAALCLASPVVSADSHALFAQNAAERANMGGLGDLLNRSTKKPSRPAAAHGNAEKGSAEKGNEKQLDAAPAEVRGPEGQGYLGMLCAEMEAKGRGVRISRITSGSPADQAGLKPSDVITGVGGTRVRQLVDLASILREARPGVTLTFDVQRGMNRNRIDVTFGSRPNEAAKPARDEEKPAGRAEGGAVKPVAKTPEKPAAKAKPAARPAARILDATDSSPLAAPLDLEERNRAAAKRAERLGLGPQPDKKAADPPRGRTDRDWDALLERIERLERRIEQLERRENPTPRAE